MAQAQAQGHSGGIIILWHDDLFMLDQIEVTSEAIHSIVQVPPSPTTWLFSVIYAKNDLHARTSLWANLMSMHDNILMSWLLGGDFNELTCANEKYMGNPINNSRCDQFIQCLNYCNLLDLGFRGSRYTWTNK